MQIMPTPHRWDHLEAFLATRRAGSLLAAAEELGVNATTVARRLEALEAALDIQLFERTPGGVLPTLAAEQLLPWAEGVEQAQQAFVHAVQGLEREPVGRVKVTGPPGLVDHLVVPALGELRASFPGLQVELDASVAYADLSRGEADIAIRGRRPERGDLVARRLGPYGSAVLGAPEVYARAAPAEALGSLPWVQWGADLAHLADARFIEAHVPPEAIVLRTSSFAGQVEAARRGLAVMLAARPFASIEGLCEVPLDGPAATAVAGLGGQSIWLVGHRALRRVPRVAVVWEFLADRLQAARDAAATSRPPPPAR